MRAHALDRDADLRLFVNGEIVEDHDIAGVQRGHQHLLDVREKTGTVDRPVEDGWGAQAVEAQRGHDGVRLPVTAGRVIAEAGAAWTAAVAPEEIGRHAALIEEDVVPRIAERLPGAPAPALSDDVGPALFVGV